MRKSLLVWKSLMKFRTSYAGKKPRRRCKLAASKASRKMEKVKSPAE